MYSHKKGAGMFNCCRSITGATKFMMQYLPVKWSLVMADYQKLCYHYNKVGHS
jgi:hypothetical protein